MTDAPRTMHEYYAGQDVLPTFGDLVDEEAVADHERHRRRLFTDKLGLPPQLFAGARVLELGPDAGENSLVFARWGAELTLAEPHRRAHDVIRAYLDRFGLADRVAALTDEDLEGFPAPARGAEFDVVDAEGFVNAVQPMSLWIEKLARLLRPEGLAIVFYNETYGCLLELTWKTVHARYRALTGLDAPGAARAVYATKWASIPHKRPIESWTMDVLENPFVRLGCFVEPVRMLTEAAGAGLALYSSWPRYEDGLDVYWFKREPSQAELLQAQIEHVRRSRLSHVLGRRCYLSAAPDEVEAVLLTVLQGIDGLIDSWDDEAADRIADGADRLAEIVASDDVLASEDDRRRGVAMFALLGRLVEVLGADDPDAIARFANDDEDFVAFWGLASHFAVLRRLPG